MYISTYWTLVCMYLYVSLGQILGKLVENHRPPFFQLKSIDFPPLFDNGIYMYFEQANSISTKELGLSYHILY